MKQTLSRKLKKIVSVCLAVCMVTMLALSTAMPAYADDKQQELEAQKQALQAELDAAKEQLANIEAGKADAEQEKATLQNKSSLIASQINVISQQITDTQSSIDEKTAEIEEKQASIEKKEAEIAARWSDFKDRMAAMQQLKDGGAISMITMATNLYELLTFSETLTEIMDKDDDVLQQMETEQTALREEKQQMEDAKAQLEANQASLEDQQSQLDSKKTELVASIQQQDATITEAEALAQVQEAEVASKQAEFDKAADELDGYLRSLIAQTQADYVDAPISCSLNFICPLDSYKYISCNYGVNGHKGVDFAAAGNTPIRAVASGVVTTATYHYSYGNYVMVYHGTDDSGNTYATLYAHMISSPSVSAGQSVSQGDVLGYVGSTGNSTGNHLHLEMRVNGARTNALNYVPH